jgi:adiponectin receptor
MPSAAASGPNPGPTRSGVRSRHHDDHHRHQEEQLQLKSQQPRSRRPSTASTILSTAQALENKLEHALLVLWDDLPHWRRDNPSILSGYRATSNSIRGSLASLWYLHNESVNIWTHLLGAIAFAVGGVYLYALVAPRYESASAADVLVFGCFFGGAFCCLGMSATFHTLCNHSEKVAMWGNKLDYTGIVFLIVGSFVPALWYGFYCWEVLLTVYLGAVSQPPLPLSRIGREDWDCV